jgi:hypothetical protein
MEILNEKFKIYSNEIETDKDKLAILLHLIMLDSGFTNTNNVIKQIKRNQFNKIYYNQTKVNLKQQGQSIVYSLKHDLILILLQSGSTIDLNMKYDTFSSAFMKLNLKHIFYQPQFYVSKQTDLTEIKNNLEIEFKNKILNPFKFYLKSIELDKCLSENYNYINGILDLPIELIIKLALVYLDINSIVCLFSTNCYLYKLFNSDQMSDSSIWLKLIKRDFKTCVLNTSTTNNVNYRNKYVKLYFDQKLFNKKYN